ncbi:hypothetical protein [Acinetobacter baumannii]|uniref:hypothetical protein n=1 Tax=Acinetobacter baumannii TaxID=470 RepID=UPI000DF46308|nr:hypothetical protein [Acinetobacter baumannii]RCT89700.1 hypothetical protein DVA68_16010 [Acinetobacter baumannii]
MASTSAERKRKQRNRMLEKGYSRKDFWLTKTSVELIEQYKADKKLDSNDDALNKLLDILIRKDVNALQNISDPKI